MNNISKTTFLKYLRCQRAATFEMQIAPLVANYKKQLKTITKAEEKELLEQIVVEIMDNTVKLNVPLKVGVNYGENWYEAWSNNF